jgi:hypothetical protein
MISKTPQQNQRNKIDFFNFWPRSLWFKVSKALEKSRRTRRLRSKSEEMSSVILRRAVVVL